MTSREAFAKAKEQSQRSDDAILVVERTDHPHVDGPYYYAISEAHKTAWTKGERKLARYRNGQMVTVYDSLAPSSVAI